jgi:hypothetical protein
MEANSLVSGSFETQVFKGADEILKFTKAKKDFFLN